MQKIIYKDRYIEFWNYKLEFKTEAFIGKKGLTKNKVEGDMKTPIGIFETGLIFGIKNDIINKMNYHKISKFDYFVDDVDSKYYNQLVDIRNVEKTDWKTAEHLIEFENQYKYVIEIKVNPNNIRGKGSAIFLHCIGDKNYTAGCIAIKEEYMKKIIKDIEKNCIFEIY